jgi:NitT/TauT family transport system permease protein
MTVETPLATERANRFVRFNTIATPAVDSAIALSTAATKRMPKVKKAPRGLRALLGNVGFITLEIIALLVVWQVVVWALAVDPNIVPGPISVLTSLWQLLQSPLLYSAAGVTLSETLIGFVAGSALGIALAIALSEFPLVEKIANPYIVAFQAMPKIAIAPLFLIWFGFGIESKVALVIVMVFFPILVNMVVGLKSTSQAQLELMMVYRAGRLQMLRRLRFYAAMPYLFAAFEVTLVLSLTGAVFAEILGSGRDIGLGTLMQLYTSKLNVSSMFAVIIVLCIVGVLLYAAVKLAARYFLRWQNPPR